MNLPNLSSLPEDKPEIVGPLTYAVPGQGEFTFWLRGQDLPASLASGAVISERVQQWCQPQSPRYPSELLIAQSETLWQTVIFIRSQLCGPEGTDLGADEQPSEDYLLRMSKVLPSVFSGLGSEAIGLVQRSEERLGNSHVETAAPSSAPVSTTEEPPTPT